jgi:hypothetical protein
MGEELEREAIALVNQYGWAMPTTVKKFFKKVAAFNGWKKLEGML